MAPFGLDQPTVPPPVTPDSPRGELLEFVAGAELGFQQVFAALLDEVPGVESVESKPVTIPRRDGGELPLTVHRPTGDTGRLPVVVHLHGGGMVLLTAADPGYVHWRSRLAATGVIVVGVEYRNGGGVLGAHPYPAGLDDCADAVRWAVGELGGAGVVVSGESGGGNLTLAVSHRARREGWLSDIAGVYAQCPYIYGGWASPPDELISLRENDRYFVSCELFAALAEVYDPGGAHFGDVECWPSRAGVEQLRGMPPHAISVNELDPLRDEGIAYYRQLARAGVPVVGRVVTGTCHGGDVLFPVQLPDVYAASVRDLSGFAKSVCAS
jgi:acetyl esterase/lipase